MAFDLAMVSTAYQVIGNFARSMAEAKSAKAIAIKTSEPIRDELLEKGGDKLAKTAEEAAEKRLDTASEVIDKAEREIASLAQQLKRKLGNSGKTAKLSRRLARDTEALRGSLQASKSASRVIKAAKFTGGVGLPLVFLAHDLYEAVEEYMADVGSPE